MKKEGVIYRIINKINNKSYIGQTSRYDRRIKEHLRSACSSKYKDYNCALHRAIRKHGIQNFMWEILYVGSVNPDLLNELEILFISIHKTYKYGYNSNIGGGSNNGYKTSEETKKKQSLLRKGKKLSKETIEKIVAKNTGKKRSQEFKDMLSEKAKGRKMTDDAKHKMSLSKIGKKRSCESVNKTKIGNSGRNNYKYDHTLYTFYHSIYGTEISTRRDFIIKYNLHHSKIGLLIKGKKPQYKGWKIIHDNI